MHPTRAASTTYYVDASRPDDLGNGISEATAWKTLTKVNSAMVATTIKAGDSVLFKKDETFAGYLSVTVTGTAGNILSFGAYGSGANPIINAAGNTRAVNLQSKNYLTFQDLSLINGTSTGFYMNAGADHIVMDRVSVTTSGNAFSLGTGTNSNIIISNATVSGGGRSVVASGFTAVSDILIDNSIFDANTINGILIDASTTGTASNITISNSSITNNAAVNNAGVRLVNITGGITMTNVTISDNHQYGLTMAGCSNVTMTGLTVNANLFYGIAILDNGATKLATNISLDNTEITNNGSHARESGIYFGGTENNSNATLTNVAVRGNYGDGFNVHGAWQNIVCDTCLAENNGVDGSAGDGDGFSWHDTTTGTIKNSIARNNIKSAIAQVNGASLDMYNNLFYHSTNGTWPLVNIGYTLLESSGNYNFYNNTIYSPAHTGTGLSVNATGGTINIKNNIIMGFDVGLAVVAGSPTADYNDVYGATTNLYSGISAGAHDINTDPNIVNPSTDFHLQSTSPAIDAGLDTSIPTDYAGDQRYDDPDVANTGSGAIAYHDIGAYEYVTPPSPNITSSSHPSQTAWYNSSTPIIAVNPTSSTTSYKYLVNQTQTPLKTAVEAGVASASGSFTVSAEAINADGVWYVHMIGKNLDGDFSTNYSSYTIKYDGTNPTVAATVDPLAPDGNDGWYKTDPEITLSATDLTSGVDVIVFNWDSDSAQIYSDKISAPVGTHTLYYYAIDDADNISDTSSATFKVETTVPATSAPAASTSDSSTTDSSAPATNIPIQPTGSAVGTADTSNLPNPVSTISEPLDNQYGHSTTSGNDPESKNNVTTIALLIAAFSALVLIGGLSAGRKV